jgi:hypothetical protein
MDVLRVQDSKVSFSAVFSTIGVGWKLMGREKHVTPFV